jgi:hypothetical protein
MAYDITYTDGRRYATLGEGALDTTLGISLIGQNFHNYGQLIGNNFLRLLEHHANTTSPTFPIEGQLWWDSGNKQLKAFTGTEFKVISNSLISSSAPLTAKPGEFWWNNVDQQLYVFNDAGEWVLIGPGSKAGDITTTFESHILIDNASISHQVSLLKVGGNVLSVLSKDAEFTLNGIYLGLTKIIPGINLVSGIKIQGTATNSDNLLGLPGEDYINKFTPDVTFTGNVSAKSLQISSAAPLKLESVGNDKSITTLFGDLTISNTAGTLLFDSHANQVTLVSPSPISPDALITKQYLDLSASAVTTQVTNDTNTKISNLVNGATLNTLRKLSDAINNDANYFTTAANSLLAKANIDSPNFVGTPTLVTAPSITDNSNRLATTSFVKSAVSDVVASQGVTFTAANSTLTAPATNETLVFDGTKWVNKNIASTITSKIKSYYGTPGEVELALVTGSTTSTSGGDVVVSLSTSPVVAGEYTAIQKITVDTKGRVTNIVASIPDINNPTLTSKVYDSTTYTSWWFEGLVSVGATHWNNNNLNYSNQFIDSTSMTYRNHPFYQTYTESLASKRYFSTICCPAYYEFKCDQPTRVVISNSSSAALSNSVPFSIAYYLKVEKLNNATGIWEVYNTNENAVWSNVIDSTGQFNGVKSVAIETSAVAGDQLKRDFTATFPNATSLPGMTESGIAASQYDSTLQPALPAGFKYRFTLQVYVAASQSYATLSIMTNSTWFTLKGE